MMKEILIKINVINEESKIINGKIHWICSSFKQRGEQRKKVERQVEKMTLKM